MDVPAGTAAQCNSKKAAFPISGWDFFFFWFSFKAEETRSVLSWPQESKGTCLIPSQRLPGTEVTWGP